MNISTVNMSQETTDALSNITIIPNIMSHVGFRLAYLELTLTYFKGQHGNRNGVSPNILAFLLMCVTTKLPYLHFTGLRMQPSADEAKDINTSGANK